MTDQPADTYDYASFDCFMDYKTHYSTYWP